MSLRFLIVDDTRFMRLMLTDILRKLDYEVAGEADNGERAIELYREYKPDIVFMDISMPGMDGVEALTHIRRADPDAIVIICSAVSQQELIEGAMAQGASGYVMKPFKPKQIREVIEKVKPAKPDKEEAKSLFSAIGSDWMAKMQALREKREEAGEEAEVVAAEGEAGQWSGESAPYPAVVTAPELEEALASPAEAQAEERERVEAVPPEETTSLSETALVADTATQPEEAGQEGEQLSDAATPQEEIAFAEQALSPEGTVGREEAVPEWEDTALREAADPLPESDLPPEQCPPIEPDKTELSGQRFERLVGCQWTDEADGSETIYRAWLAPGSTTLDIACEANGGSRMQLSVDALAHLLDWVKAQSGPSLIRNTERSS